MRKFFIFLTLSMSSFFLLSQNVKATEFNYSIPNDDFSYISSSDFNTVKQAVSNSSYYVIFFNYYSSTGLFNTSNYYVLLDDPSIMNIELRYNSSTGTYMRFKRNDNFVLSVYRYDFNTSSLILDNYNLRQLDCYIFLNNSTNKYLGYLDSNYDIISNSTHVFNFTSYGYNFTISSGSIIPTLNYIYLQGLPDPTPVDNTPILTSFYTTVGSKIGWLGEQFADNYIYIAILGVMILIFLIELIRRYLL